MGLSICIDTGAAPSNNQKIIMAAAATAVAVGTGLYWKHRESNAVKIQRVDSLCAQYHDQMQVLLQQIQTMQDVYDFNAQALGFTLKLNSFDQQVHAAYQDINERYNFWLTPWNYTQDMKQAYEKMSALREQWRIDLKVAHSKIDHMSLLKQAMENIAYFSSCLGTWHGFADEADLLKFARKICLGSSTYPVHATVMTLRQALNLLKCARAYVACDQALIDKMEQICTEMLISQSYLDEAKEKQEEERAQQAIALQERLARAEEEKARAEKNKAWAAQQQAWAQQAQARAQEEQAAAQRERNRIEKDKLNKKQ